MTTPTDTDYERIAREWAGERGKRPNDTGFGFEWWDLEAEPEGLPAAVYAELNDIVHGSQAECFVALGRAIVACRDAVGFNAAIAQARQEAYEEAAGIVIEREVHFETPSGYKGTIAAIREKAKGVAG